jgi:ribosome-associated protein
MTKQNIIKAEELVELAKAALEDVKAQDIQVIDVREKHSLTDYMIIATGTSNRQINAMLEKVRELVKAKGVQPLGEEGKGESDWVLLDLERLWMGAEQSRAADGKHHSSETGANEFFDKLTK